MSKFLKLSEMNVGGILAERPVGSWQPIRIRVYESRIEKRGKRRRGKEREKKRKKKERETKKREGKKYFSSGEVFGKKGEENQRQDSQNRL